nr:hypothetical protein [Tanacetum cinerariifolium]
MTNDQMLAEYGRVLNLLLERLIGGKVDSKSIGVSRGSVWESPCDSDGGGGLELLGRISSKEVKKCKGGIYDGVGWIERLCNVHGMGDDSFDEISMKNVSWEERPLSTWHDLEDTLFEYMNHHVIHKIEIIRECMRMSNVSMLKKSSEKHSIRKSHINALGHTYHSIGNVVGKIKVFSNGKTIDHLAETSIGMVLISREAYSVFTKDDFPFFKIGFNSDMTI